MNNDVVIYQSSDGLVKMEAIVDASNETIWATQKAMAQLFGVNVSGISRHLVNVFSSGELDEKSNLQKMQIAKSDKPVAFYSLDVIISVGYRVNSIRATAFRQWAGVHLQGVPGMVQRQRYKHHLYPAWPPDSEQHNRTLQRKLP